MKTKDNNCDADLDKDLSHSRDHLGNIFRSFASVCRSFCPLVVSFCLLGLLLVFGFFLLVCLSLVGSGLSFLSWRLVLFHCRLF